MRFWGQGFGVKVLGSGLARFWGQVLNYKFFALFTTLLTVV